VTPSQLAYWGLVAFILLLYALFTLYNAHLRVKRERETRRIKNEMSREHWERSD